jgi:hypothetical protein
MVGLGGPDTSSTCSHRMGTLSVSAGAWVIQRRPHEIAIDPADRTVTYRRLVTDVCFSFPDVSTVEVLQSQAGLVVADVPILGTVHYDVGIRMSEGNLLTMHQGLDSSSAYLRAQKLAAIIAKPI